MNMQHSSSADLATHGYVRKKLQAARGADRMLTIAMTKSAAAGQHASKDRTDATEE
jgi:hypothetical protein